MRLTTVHCRLEAATSRLEDMAVSFEGASQANHVNNLAPPVQQTAIEPAKQDPSPPTPTPQPDPAQIEDFDALIKSDVQAFVDLGKQIGGLVGEQVTRFESVHYTYNERVLTWNLGRGSPSSIPSRTHLYSRDHQSKETRPIGARTHDRTPQSI